MWDVNFLFDARFTMFQKEKEIFDLFVTGTLFVIILLTLSGGLRVIDCGTRCSELTCCLTKDIERRLLSSE